MASTRTPVLPPAWGDLLDQVQQSLAIALEQADQRLRALEATMASAPTQTPTDNDTARQQLDARMNETARQIQDADVALATVEEALRSWLQSSATAQRTLAERVAGAIG